MKLATWIDAKCAAMRYAARQQAHDRELRMIAAVHAISFRDALRVRRRARAYVSAAQAFGSDLKLESYQVQIVREAQRRGLL